MRRAQRRIVTAYIVSTDGKILLGKKDPNKGGVYPDCLHNPGGGVDVDESDEEALTREVMEETGIDIQFAQKTLIDIKGTGESEKTLKTGEKIIVEMHFYVYRVDLGKTSDKVELFPHSDLIDLRWYPIESLEQLRLTPPAAKLITHRGLDWLTGAYNK
jgi:8-oxo-dGTP pyrophosphatase MutT (NUDIX family)